MESFSPTSEALRTTSGIALITYFALQDESDARKTWDALLTSLKIDRHSISFSETDRSANHPMVATSGKNSAFFTILYRTIAVGVFLASDEDFSGDKRAVFQSSRASIGTTTVYIGSAGTIETALPLEFRGTVNISQDSGLVPVKLGCEHHLFAYLTSESNEALAFLPKHFTKIDSLLHHLDATVPLYKDLASNAMEKRKKADEKIARLLSEQVVGEHSVEGIKTLENDVDHLAALYASLAADLSLLRKSRDSLAQDLRHLDRMRSLGYDPDNFSIEGHKTILEELGIAATRLDESLEDLHAAITIVGNKVELMRSRENVTLQKEALSLQVSAGFIEFIILFYYALHSWETLVTKEHLERIPAIFQALIVVTFSGLIVGFTHEISKRYRGENHGYMKPVLLGTGAVIVIGLMGSLPTLLK